VLAASSSGALAQKKYDTGATDTEIQIGNIMPLQRACFSLWGDRQDRGGLFQEINDAGAASTGRKINFISYDDGYSPPKTVEQAAQAGGERRSSVRVQFAGHPAKFRDPEVHEFEEGAAAVRSDRRHQVERSEGFPLDHGLAAQLPERVSDLCEVSAQGKPNAKIAILFQNDDYGKDYVKGLKDGLGAKAASMIVAEESFETTEPTIDNHIVKAQIDRCGRVLQRLDPEIRGTGHQENSGDRMETAASS